MFALLKQGGPMVILILISGLVALAVFLERVLHLHRARIKSEDFLRGICNNLARGNTAEAVTICDETPGPVAYIVRTAIVNREAGLDAMREAVNQAGRTEISRMERRLSVLATVAQVTPLMGLLGTVLGLIRATLVVQQQAPLVQSADIARGLMEAMVSTAAGLTVAIPCYVAFNFLLTRVEKIVLDMEHAASEILGFLGGSRPGGSPEEEKLQ